MTLQELEHVGESERSGAHVGTRLSAADYFMLYGTGEVARREAERAAWNAEVDRRKAERKQK